MRRPSEILAEIANGPTTPDADVILARNGVFLIPDILCNAGGVFVNYFSGPRTGPRSLAARRIKSAAAPDLAAAVRLARADSGRIDPRLAAHSIAVERVAGRPGWGCTRSRSTAAVDRPTVAGCRRSTAPGSPSSPERPDSQSDSCQHLS
jgi:hypothetical protein